MSGARLRARRVSSTLASATRSGARAGAATGRGTGRLIHRMTSASGAGRTGLGNLIELTAAGSAGDAFVTVALAGTLFFNTSLDQARSHARGVTGLRRVLRSLEAGEVQTLLLGENYHAQAVECSACGHLDAHLVSFCPVCGHETREIVDVGEAILPRAIRQDVELFYVKDDPEFDKVGNIAALLRFRSEQNSNSNNVRSIADVPPNPNVSRRTRLVGRYRGLASG